MGKWHDRFDAERDRRYAEIAVEREKALRIKEEADRVALALASDIQKYKDEKANELRTQIERERGGYPTRIEMGVAFDKLAETIKPLAEYVTSQQGRGQGLAQWYGWIILAIGLVAAVFVAVKK